MSGIACQVIENILVDMTNHFAVTKSLLTVTKSLLAGAKSLLAGTKSL